MLLEYILIVHLMIVIKRTGEKGRAGRSFGKKIRGCNFSYPCIRAPCDMIFPLLP